MGVNLIAVLNQVAHYLKVEPGKVSSFEDWTYTSRINGETQTGIINIIMKLVSESKATPLKVKSLTPLEEATVRSWIELTCCRLASLEDTDVKRVFSDINRILEDKTYIVLNTISIADIVLYYSVQGYMEKLSYLEKEKLLHLCRWFDNMQQDPLIRQSNKIIDFKTNYLATVVPARH